jgi:hypothetical protein
MNRKDLVEKLISEGFSEKTLVGFSDKKLKMLSERLTVSAEKLKDPKIKSVIDANPDMNIEVNETAPWSYYFAAVKRLEKELGKEPTKSQIDAEMKKLAKPISKKEDKKSEMNEWVNSLVENGYHPLTTKGDMLETITRKIQESGNAPATKPAPKEAPVKDPGTKEPPKRRDDPRRTPFRNPNENPKVNPNPKAETGKVVPMPNKAKKGHNGIPEFMTYDAITGNKFKMAAE